MKGPIYRPSQCKCSGCGEVGHHIGNCVKTIEDRLAKSHSQCVRGFHFPYLHGVWRCTYCGVHLHDDEVRRQLPMFYESEASKDYDKQCKYGSPLTRWQ